MGMKEWQPPTCFADFRLEKILGRGGMGRVFLAYDMTLDRRVAIKFIAGLTENERARERFRIEARAIARLQHPNVVCIYHCGDVDGHPYLVSEYIAGTTLTHLRKPVPWEQALPIGLGLSRGLAAAHRQGVLHRDIKPANAILGYDGQAKLVDFGTAKLFNDVITRRVKCPTERNRNAPEAPGEHAADEDDAPFDNDPSLTGKGFVMGTPRYMAPETLFGAPATPQSDVYSLGLILYELCTGRQPQVPNSYDPADNTADGLDEETGTAMTPLRYVASHIDARFAAIIDRCLALDPQQRFRDGAAVQEALEQVNPTSSGATVVMDNPYRGLLCFEAEHRSVFFGRSNEIRAILERLQSASMVLIAGDSGVGKSSLCRAGILPLTAERVIRGRVLTPVTMVPGHRPLIALIAALAPVLRISEAELADRARESPEHLSRLLRLPPGHDGLMLFVDQLEELITLSDPDEAITFARLLAELAALSSASRVLMTARSDFLARLAALPGLSNELGRILFFLRPLSRSGAVEAIEGPAALLGVHFETEEMVTALLRSFIAAGAGGLPLLQFSLAALWEARDREHKCIPAAALADIGGVEGALAQYADGVMSGMPEAQSRAARRIMTRLVTIDGTRTRATEREFGRSNEVSRAALEALVHSRLVMVSQFEGEPIYELAHEVLIACWPTLRRWLDDDLDVRTIWQRLDVAATDWQRMSHSADLLWNGRQLSEAARLDAEDQQPHHAAFLEASRARAQRRRMLLRAAPIAIVALSLTIYGASRIQHHREIDQVIAQRTAEAASAIELAHRAGDSATKLRDASLAITDRLAAHTLKTVFSPPAPTPPLHDPPQTSYAELLSEAEKQYEEALARDQEQQKQLSIATQALEAALGVDFGRASVRKLLAQTLFERALLCEQQTESTNCRELRQRLANHDRDGNLQRQLGEPAGLRVMSSPTDAQVRITRYVDQRGYRKLDEATTQVTTAPTGTLSLQPGSYLLRLTIAGRPEVRLPVLLKRGQPVEVSVPIPPADTVPPGYMFVPAGDFLWGSHEDERLRREFLGAPPQHRMMTPAYLIAQNETTFADWLEYLRALPTRDRKRMLPQAGDREGGLRVTEVAGGMYQLTLHVGRQSYQAREGEVFRYAGRPITARLDWLKFPVTGISYHDAQSYCRWLDDTQRVPGARLCTELEWERAARGADDRIYPHGDVLSPEDANFDETYHRDPMSFGPDEVGSHLASQSPYGINDMVGNVWEWTISARSPMEHVFRGGSWYVGRLTNRTTNRDQGEVTLRNIFVGMRVCASLP